MNRTDGPGPTAGANGDSNVQTVYARLREAILRDELPAGSRISQVQLAADLRMSRGPLREALRLLERDGLVRAEHNRMVRVAEVSFADMVELYALRITNEAFALSLTVPNMQDADIAELRDHLARMEASAEAGDWDKWRNEHRAFHLRLGAGAGERIQRLITEGFDHAERYRRIYHSEERDAAPTIAAREHAAIVEACADGDRARAAALLARHLARTALTILAHTSPEHEPVLIREAVRFVDQQAEFATANRAAS